MERSSTEMSTEDLEAQIAAAFAAPVDADRKSTFLVSAALLVNDNPSPCLSSQPITPSNTNETTPTHPSSRDRRIRTAGKRYLLTTHKVDDLRNAVLGLFGDTEQASKAFDKMLNLTHDPSNLEPPPLPRRRSRSWSSRENVSYPSEEPIDDSMISYNLLSKVMAAGYTPEQVKAVVILQRGLRRWILNGRFKEAKRRASMKSTRTNSNRASFAGTTSATGSGIHVVSSVPSIVLETSQETSIDEPIEEVAELPSRRSTARNTESKRLMSSPGLLLMTKKEEDIIKRPSRSLHSSFHGRSSHHHHAEIGEFDAIQEEESTLPEAPSSGIRRRTSLYAGSARKTRMSLAVDCSAGPRRRSSYRAKASSDEAEDGPVMPPRSSMWMFSQADHSKPFNMEHFEEQKRLGIQLFNRNPLKGIAFLLKEKVIEDPDPELVAQFLREQEGLCRQQIGVYLASTEARLAVDTLSAYTQLFPFIGGIDVCLRSFLTAFKLPVEAHKTELLLQTFARRFRQQQPDVFASEDGPFLMAFSMVLLNNEIHAGGQKKFGKTHRSDFIRNNANIDGDEELSHEFLGQIYDSILDRPIVPDSDNTTVVRDVCSKIQGITEDMAVPSRHFVCEATINEVEAGPNVQGGHPAKPQTPRAIFVFDDIIMVTKPNKGKYGLKRIFNFADFKLFPVSSAKLRTFQLCSNIDRSDWLMFTIVGGPDEISRISDLISRCISDTRKFEEWRMEKLRNAVPGLNRHSDSAETPEKEKPIGGGNAILLPPPPMEETLPTWKRITNSMKWKK